MGRYAIFNGLVYGGGTAVIPNPEGTPTDKLHSIQIDEDIYEIEGGGGSGGNAGLDATVLYNTPIISTGTYTLADDYNNYDFIGFKAGNGSTETDIRLYAVKDIQDSMNDNLVITNNVTNSWFNFTINENELTIPGKTVSTIYSVIGYKIKGGGGSSSVEANPAGTPTDTLSTIGIDGTIYNIEGSGGGSQELISYDTTITTTQYGWWTAEDKDGNTLDPDQYELIAVTPIVNNSSSWVGSWDGAFYINSVDGITHRYDVTFVNINDGGYIRTSKTWDIKVIYRDKNAAGGGSGSTVVPNPQEEPTDTLNTIEIDGVVYDIEGGSEGEGVEFYSEDEYIVGKWIDGKKLYQKSIKFSATSLPASWTTIEQNVDYNLVFPEAQCLYYTANGEPFTQSTRVFVQNGELKIQPLKELDLLSNTLKHVITIRYTKTVETDAPAWGGSVTNNYANFIDTNNIIDSGSYQGSFTYTATKDCFVNIAVVMSANDSATITIDGKLVTSGWCASLNTINPILPLKKGQTLVATASASNTSNYTVYGVSYGSGGSESGSSKVEYSTEERKIGKYFGEDLYEKSFIVSNLTIGSNWNFDVLGTSNIEIIDFSGFCEMLINGTNDKQRFNINYYDSSNAYCKTLIDQGLDDLAIQIYSNAHSFVKARITIRYTKTTT